MRNQIENIYGLQWMVPSPCKGTWCWEPVNWWLIDDPPASAEGDCHYWPRWQQSDASGIPELRGMSFSRGDQGGGRALWRDCCQAAKSIMQDIPIAQKAIWLAKPRLCKGLTDHRLWMDQGILYLLLKRCFRSYVFRSVDRRTVRNWLRGFERKINASWRWTWTRLSTCQLVTSNNSERKDTSVAFAERGNLPKITKTHPVCSRFLSHSCQW